MRQTTCSQSVGAHKRRQTSPFSCCGRSCVSCDQCSRVVSKLATIVRSMVLGGRKVKPLVAEFGTFKFGVFNPQRPSDSDRILETLPKGAKVISRRIVHGEKGRDEFLQKHSINVLGKVFHGEEVEICTFGVPSNLSEFLERAIRAGHPKSLENYVSQTMHDVAMTTFICPPHLVAKKRIEFIKKFFFAPTLLG